MAAKNRPNEIYINRIFDAPVKMVWEAWTDPDKVSKWWGPRGFTITTRKKEVKTGGVWDYTMHGPDGTDYENRTKFLEVEKYQRMVYDHGGNENQPPMFRVTVNFAEVKGKTHMEMTMEFPNVEGLKEGKKIIKSASGDSTWDRLAEYLSPKDNFVINRSFETSIENMFETWTNPKRLADWLAPKGATVQFIEANITVGGTSFYSMDTAEGVTMFGKIHYKEIKRPDRLVYTQIFCDKDGKISRHPFAPTWPETMLTTVTFTSEGENRTRVTLVWEVYGKATQAEIDMFNQAKAGMTQGWTGSFDKLEEGLNN